MSNINQGHYLTDDQRQSIVVWYKQGDTYATIIGKFWSEYQRRIYNATISGIVTKEQAHGTVQTLSKPGRPSAYNDREQRNMLRSVLKTPTMSMRDIANDETLNPKGVSKSTINSILLNNEVSSLVLPKRFTGLTKAHIDQRKKFGKAHKDWEVDDWELVIFSDESDLFPVKCGREFVHLRENQTVTDVMPVRLENQKDLTIKVWGAISCYGVGPLVRYYDTMTSDKYLQTLEGHLLQEYPQLEGSAMEEELTNGQSVPWKFMQDNASSHTAKIITDWMHENEIYSVKWPSNSPDLNIIENVWSYVKNELYQVKDQLTSKDDVWQRTVQIWNNIPLDYIENLYNDLPIRMDELKIMKGGPLNH